MRVLFIGLGSIGQRHLRLLLELVPDARVFALRSGRGGPGLAELCPRNAGPEFSSLAQALEAKPHLAVLATPSHLHLEPARALMRAGVPLLLEKPVDISREGLKELAALGEESSAPVLVGYQLRHHPAYGQIQTWLNDELIGKPLSLLAQVGQWLPDWRPGRDYKNSYSSKLSQGGGVIFDLSHEINLALGFLGPAGKVTAAGGLLSDLELESEDLAEISLKHDSGSYSHLHLDCLQRVYARDLKLIGRQGTILWDYAAGHVSLIRPDQEDIRLADPPHFERDSMFRAQMAHMLELVRGKARPVCSLAEGVLAARIALAAHESLQTERTVTL